MPRLSRPAGVAVGAAMVAMATVSAVKIAGSRIRSHRNPALDALAKAPTDPVHHLITTPDGGQLHAVEVGSGRPVVLLHGVTLQWWVWSAAITLLHDRYRVVAWDMRGHGRSRAGSLGVSMAATADDLALLLTDLDLHDAILVGHSMGGMTIGQFVRDHRDVFDERVGAVCFVATSAAAVAKRLSHGSLRTVYGIAGAALVAGLQNPLPASLRWRDPDLSAVLLRAAFGPGATGDMIEAVREMEAAMSGATMIDAGHAIAGHDVVDVLGSITVPTTVLVGDRDKLTPPGHAREIAALVPGATLTVLAGVGHQIMQEDPAALASAIDGLAVLSDDGDARRRRSAARIGPMQ